MPDPPEKLFLKQQYTLSQTKAEFQTDAFAAVTILAQRPQQQQRRTPDPSPAASQGANTLTHRPSTEGWLGFRLLISETDMGSCKNPGILHNWQAYADL